MATSVLKEPLFISHLGHPSSRRQQWWKFQPAKPASLSKKATRISLLLAGVGGGEEKSGKNGDDLGDSPALLQVQKYLSRPSLTLEEEDPPHALPPPPGTSHLLGQQVLLFPGGVPKTLISESSLWSFAECCRPEWILL